MFLTYREHALSESATADLRGACELPRVREIRIYTCATKVKNMEIEEGLSRYEGLRERMQDSIFLARCCVCHLGTSLVAPLTQSEQ